MGLQPLFPVFMHFAVTDIAKLHIVHGGCAQNMVVVRQKALCTHRQASGENDLILYSLNTFT